ncbi:transposase domain-containing protein [Streptomyces sp. NPDC007875]|uniref:transposase domain-containing protein n=1 Tax=Streptomyces sp. NPDC007875 TaxID=3364783 RepID=UPI003684F92D
MFTPGPLGKLTQVADYALVDAVVEETGTVQMRIRLLPSGWWWTSSWRWPCSSGAAPGGVGQARREPGCPGLGAAVYFGTLPGPVLAGNLIRPSHVACRYS